MMDAELYVPITAMNLALKSEGTRCGCPLVLIELSWVYILVVHVPDAQKVACPSCENTQAPLVVHAPLGAVGAPI